MATKTKGTRFKRSDIVDLPISDPLPRTYKFALKDLPKNHRFSDFVIGLMRVGYGNGDLEKRHLAAYKHVFTGEGAIRQWTWGNGHPLLDSIGAAVDCYGITLCGNEERDPSDYSTETILKDEKFAKLYAKWNVNKDPQATGSWEKSTTLA
jgi:hypothetical protein